MLVKSQAVVLRRIRYSDSDSIVCLYSRDFGRVSYLSSDRRKKSPLSPALLQPLSLIEYEADHKASRELQRLKEIKSDCPFLKLPFDPVKNTLSLFLAEVLYRVLGEAESNPPLFDFLRQSVQLLDLNEEGTANFHLAFLCSLTHFLGFYPNTENWRPGCGFDMQAGTWSDTRPAHNAWLNPQESEWLRKLLQLDYQHLGALQMNGGERTAALRKILDYYRLHLSDFPEIKSLDVLQECFSNV